MWNNARQRAKVKDIEFSLPMEWVETRLQIGICETTGLPFDYSFNRLWSPSIDKINPHGGYTPDNCQMTLFIYNSAKLQGTHEDVVKFARALIQKHDN